MKNNSQENYMETRANGIHVQCTCQFLIRAYVGHPKGHGVTLRITPIGRERRGVLMFSLLDRHVIKRSLQLDINRSNAKRLTSQNSDLSVLHLYHIIS